MNLILPLKKKWFDLTKSGVKKEDYREINEYWFIRLVEDAKGTFQYLTGCNWDEYPFEKDGAIKEICHNKFIQLRFKKFDSNVMTLGYPKKEDLSKRLTIPHGGIHIDKGFKQWGAEPSKLYFVIKHK